MKWLNKRIKEKNRNMCRDFYSSDKAVIEELVNLKVGMEKYAKKLKHMANEV
ncbi:hypothetical protein [Paenibacillus agilis]|uniref:hypothetical protein n=1 Tax=Paenibacillus agilis TaxID=3020863 RepID=UPI0021BD9D82|nr:hypothetical protein [Paenibacillus agilis]